MSKLWSVLGLGAAAFLAVIAPAMAAAVRVPEPGSLSLLAVGVGGAYLVSKYLRRK